MHKVRLKDTLSHIHDICHAQGTRSQVVEEAGLDEGAEDDAASGRSDGAR